MSKKTKWRKRIIGLIISTIILLAFIFVYYIGLETPYCRGDIDYFKVSETIGALPGGTCYCPTDKLLPTGLPVAMWGYQGNDLWRCLYVL